MFCKLLEGYKDLYLRFPNYFTMLVALRIELHNLILFTFGPCWIILTILRMIRGVVDNCTSNIWYIGAKYFIYNPVTSNLWQLLSQTIL